MAILLLLRAVSGLSSSADLIIFNVIPAEKLRAPAFKYKTNQNIYFRNKGFNVIKIIVYFDITKAENTVSFYKITEFSTGRSDRLLFIINNTGRPA